MRVFYVRASLSIFPQVAPDILKGLSRINFAIKRVYKPFDCFKCRLKNIFTQSQVEFACINCVAYLICSIPIVYIYAALQQPQFKVLVHLRPHFIDRSLVCLFTFHLFLKSVVVHDRLEKHPVLILKTFGLLLQELFNFIFSCLLAGNFKMAPNIGEVYNFMLD